MTEKQGFMTALYERLSRDDELKASSCPLLGFHSGRTALESPGRDRQALQCPHGSDDSRYEKNRKVSQKP